MFKVIIWATDGSSGAEQALPYAKDLAQALLLGQHRLPLHRLDQARWVGERIVHVDFHDELLGFGSMPVPLVARLMASSRPHAPRPMPHAHL